MSLWWLLLLVTGGMVSSHVAHKYSAKRYVQPKTRYFKPKTRPLRRNESWVKISTHTPSAKNSRPLRKKSLSKYLRWKKVLLPYGCAALHEYEKYFVHHLDENDRPSASYNCSTYESCLEAHLDKLLYQKGLHGRCNMTEYIQDIQEKKVSPEIPAAKKPLGKNSLPPSVKKPLFQKKERSSYGCAALHAYEKHFIRLDEKDRPSASYQCASYESCLEVHLVHLCQYGLLDMCNMTEHVRNMQAKKCPPPAKTPRAPQKKSLSLEKKPRIIEKEISPYQCSALQEYEKHFGHHTRHLDENDRLSASYRCNSYESCLEAHLDNLRQNGLLDRCNMTEYITRIQDKKITFTHIPKAGGSSVEAYMRSTPRLATRISEYADPHLPFYLQQKESPLDFYFTILRNPVKMMISFFNYASQWAVLPNKLKCEIGWELVFLNKKTPLKFALHHNIAEADFFYYFAPPTPNVSVAVKEWVSWRPMQALSPASRTLQHSWSPGFSRARYLRYLSLSDAVFPKRYQCQKHIEASALLLERYAAVGTLEKLLDVYKVLHHRAKIKGHGNTSIVVNKSVNSTSPEIEKEMSLILKEPMFCQTLLWRMAGEINSADLACIKD